MSFALLKLTAGAIATIGLYSVLYRENRFYRFFEHMFLGLAAGYALVALWTETLKASWYDLMTGETANGLSSKPGYWAWIFLFHVGLMAYFVFSKKHNWISRIPIGILLGLFAGQQADAFVKKFWPQIEASARPIIPNSGFFVPASGPPPNSLYVSQAISNLIFLITIFTVVSYFFFSFDWKSKIIKNMTITGRWLLMIGFGAIFGTTIMTRFSLLIDRMYFIWIEWLMQGILNRG